MREINFSFLVFAVAEFAVQEIRDYSHFVFRADKFGPNLKPFKMHLGCSIPEIQNTGSKLNCLRAAICFSEPKLTLLKF